MKRLQYTLLCCLIGTLLHGQSASLFGTIRSTEGPLEFATLRLEGPDFFQGTTTDESGNYRLANIPAGTFVLTISRLGYQTYTETIQLTANQELRHDVELEADRLQLDEVVVSATRYQLDRSDAPVVVSVVGERLFEATQSMALSEGLHFQPGVRVETNCQNCGFTQVRLNGLEGGYSQILINSRPVFSALNSVYGLDQIPTSIIDRVEVVRSGGSALFGSNAIAGTINIITKEPILNTWSVGSNFALIDGEVPDRTLNFNGSLVSDDLRSGVTFYGMTRKRNAFDANGDGFSEMTLLENNTIGAKAFFKPGYNSKITFDASAIREYRRGGDRLDLAPHFADITEELDHNTFLGGLTFDLYGDNDRNKFSTYLSGQTTQRDSYYGGLGGGRTAEDSTLALNAYGNTEDLALVSGLQLVRRIGARDVLTVGVEHQFSDVRDEIPGYNRLVDQQVTSSGVYAQYEWKPNERFTALLGARYDQTSVDGSYNIGAVQRQVDVSIGVLSPRATFLYDLTNDLQLRGGYARGFRAPQAFNEDLHISSVGGEPQFVILSDNLDKELSDAFTASLNYAHTFGRTQTNFLFEGFHTQLRQPFTIVSTGAVLPNGSILEEVRNGASARVSGFNVESSISPSGDFLFQLGGTLQQTRYEEAQILFEPEDGSSGETTVAVEEFVRTPTAYGYFVTNYRPNEHFSVDLTGAYTGPMIVPRVVSESGFLNLIESDPFLEFNLKLSYHFDLTEAFQLELSGGIQNAFNSYQDDFDIGPTRDSDFIYGPGRPRTFFVGVKVGDFH